MRAVWALTVAGLAGVAAFMAWVVVRTGAPDSPLGRAPWTGGSPHIAAAMAIAVVGAGGLAAGLMWLAFFSARRGYDDRVAEWDDEDPPGLP